ncbi:MAG TPA: hypothetical protein VID50_05215 [Candidatus Eisenbacteria bacterium]
MTFAADPAGAALWTRPLDALYRFFSPAEAPRPADAIFVYAGQQERKEYGLALWREGLAPTLILSIGRFEWRRIAALDLPGDGGLVPLVQATPAPERHFLLILGPRGAEARRLRRGPFGTATETLGLLEAAAARGLRSVLVVSTGPHLRRIRIALRRLARGRGSQYLLVAVPEDRTLHPRARWWGRPETRRMIAAEAAKCFGYALLPRRLLVPRGSPMA